jgi:hypothetical protein
MESHLILAISQIRRSRFWHLFVGVLVGVGAAVLFMFPSASALEQQRVKAAFMKLGDYLCEGDGGLESIQSIGDDRYRFECKDTTVIEQRAIIR